MIQRTTHKANHRHIRSNIRPTRTRHNVNSNTNRNRSRVSLNRLRNSTTHTKRSLTRHIRPLKTRRLRTTRTRSQRRSRHSSSSPRPTQPLRRPTPRVHTTQRIVRTQRHHNTNHKRTQRQFRRHINRTNHKHTRRRKRHTRRQRRSPRTQNRRRHLFRHRHTKPQKHNRHNRHTTRSHSNTHHRRNPPIKVTTRGINHRQRRRRPTRYSNRSKGNISRQTSISRTTYLPTHHTPIGRNHTPSLPSKYPNPHQSTSIYRQNSHPPSHIRILKNRTVKQRSVSHITGQPRRRTPIRHINTRTQPRHHRMTI